MIKESAIGRWCELPLGRREFILGLCASAALCSCQRHYVRPGGDHDLGPVEDLLQPQKYLRDKSLLLYHNDRGWSVMSTVCTYDGCDLTYQAKMLFCSCCASKFDLRGKVIEGPSTDSLPWFKIYFADNHLYADSGTVVEEVWHFMTPEVEQLLKTIHPQAQTNGENIPGILLGQGDEQLKNQADAQVFRKLDQSKAALDEIQKRAGGSQ